MTRLPLILLVLAGLGLWTATAALYSVDETQQALVVRLGKASERSDGPGLKLKAPLIDTVIYYDARLLPLEPPPEQIILGDKKRIDVATFSTYRIADPLRFYQSVRNIDQARTQLGLIVSSSIRRELGRIPLRALLTEERAAVVEAVRREVSDKARPLGIEVVEVHIHRADLPPETSQAIYDRMKSEREREAKEVRAQGFEGAQHIKARADSERTVILSEAQRDSKMTRAQGDAEAGRLYADAFGRDPQFYKFYRSLQTYRQALADSSPTLVLSPNAEFLHGLSTGPGQ